MKHCKINHCNLHFLHMHTYIYIFVFTFVCMYVFVYACKVYNCKHKSIEMLM